METLLLIFLINDDIAATKPCNSVCEINEMINLFVAGSLKLNYL